MWVMTNGSDRVEDAPAHRRATRSVRDLPGRRASARAARPARARRALGGGAHRDRLGHGRRRPERDRARRGGARPARRASPPSPGPGSRSSPRSRASARPRPARLAAAFELGRRSVADWPAGRWTIRTPRDVAERLQVEMGRLEREELRVLSLNAKNVVQRVSQVYVGNVTSSLVRVGELFRDAVRLDASGIVLVHNHPSRRPDAVARGPAPHRGGDRRRAAAGPRRARPRRDRARRLGLAPRPRGLVRPARAAPRGGWSALSLRLVGTPSQTSEARSSRRARPSGRRRSAESRCRCRALPGRVHAGGGPGLVRSSPTSEIEAPPSSFG